VPNRAHRGQQLERSNLPSSVAQRTRTTYYATKLACFFLCFSLRFMALGADTAA
jgi:hypothetical protein